MSTVKVGAIRGVSASSDAITVANDGTCTANITNKPNRNLIINGAMQVAQRGTTSTASGFATLDRFLVLHSGTDEAPTQEQADVAAGTTPYTLGFRKSLKITNGNQTSGAGTADYILINYKTESQDIAKSGWNYTDPNSFITFSFWVKSSVAQNFYVRTINDDSPKQRYAFETGSLSADTWTKVTKTIPGNSNLVFNNDNGIGLYFRFYLFRGTDHTSNSVNLNQWETHDSSQNVPDVTTTWYTTNDATFEMTGVQLEVGSVATDFEFRSFAQELALCQRYFCKTYNYGVVPGTAADSGSIFGRNYSDASRSQNPLDVRFPVSMRHTPTTVNGYAPHSGTIAKLSSGGSNPGNSNTEKTITAFNMLGENGFSGIASDSIGATEFFGLHFTADAEL